MKKEQNTYSFVLFAAVMALSLCALCTSSLAANVKVRTGEHADYSRIVFEWDSSFKAQVKEADTALLITFNHSAPLDTSAVSIADRTNILAMRVEAKDPLTVEIQTPEGSRHRKLQAGKKFILDIYSPAKGKGEKKQVKALKKLDQVKVVEKAPPSQNVLKEAKNSTNTNKNSAASDVGDLDLMKEIANAQPHKVQIETPLQKASKIQDTNMVTISSTKSIGLAVFEKDGYLWTVTDREKLFIRPQAAGSKAKALNNFDKVKVEGGQAFRVKIPGKSYITTAGSGLLWRIKLSPDKPSGADKPKPVTPKRSGGKQGELGGGSLFWPLEGALKVIDVVDPRTGEELKVISVQNSKMLAGGARSFVEFELLNSWAGMAIRPKVDDLKVKIVKGGVRVSRNRGLSLLPQEVVGSAIPRKYKANKTEEALAKGNFIYRFPEWEMGGAEALEENRSSILAAIPDMTEDYRIEKLVTLGKMHLANGYASEALGFLNFAQAELPELEYNPEFIAIRGAAEALNWKSEKAFNDLLSPQLKGFDDIAYWKAFALADLSDWTQAGEVLPKDIRPIYDYPAAIRDRLALGLAEVALRAGNVAQAEELLRLAGQNENDLMLPQKAALTYLKGEAARQNDDVKTTYNLWESLLEGEDDLYRAKAGLAHTRLKIDENKLDANKAIDTLERLRYSWRGDELETQVNYWLGRTYFEGDYFLKGLRIMRDSAYMAPTPEYAREITAEMGEVFANLYLGDKLDEISALDAIALYQQFSELVPSNDKGNKIIERLSQHLVKSNLLTRAANLLDHQVKHRLSDEEIVRVGTKLAGIQFIDQKPDRTLRTLDWVEEKLSNLSATYPKEQAMMDITVWRLKALGDLDRPDEALEILEELDRTPPLNRLRADIAWNAQYWDDAADALNDVILDENISLTRPLNEEQATMILNRAIALNLDSDRIAIANIREKYSQLMDQTAQARLFEVITRPRQNVRLADRQTLLSTVSEVELFKDFMDSYRNTLTGGK